MNSRQKGSKAEIEVAKLLEAWWQPYESAPDGPVRFVRTPLSGGWGTKDARAGFEASGDLMTTAPTFPFVVEVKRREGWAWSTLLAGRPCPIWNYWRQAIAQAKEMKKHPLLFFRKNREPWSVMMSRRLLALRLLRFAHGGAVLPDPKRGLSEVTRIYERDEISADFGGIVPALASASQLFDTDPSFWVQGCRSIPPP